MNESSDRGLRDPVVGMLFIHVIAVLISLPVAAFVVHGICYLLVPGADFPLLFVCAFFVFTTAVCFAILRFKRESWAFTAMATFIHATAVVVIGGVVFPNLFGTWDRGCQKQAMDDIDAMAKKIQQYSETNGGLPELASVRDLNMLTNSDFPEKDRWYSRFQISCSQHGGLAIVSYGSDGKLDVASVDLYEPGFHIDPAADIVWRDTGFIRIPEGMSHRSVDVE